MLSVTQMHRGQLHARSCRHDPFVDGPYRPSGRTAYPRGVIPPTIMSPARRHSGSSTEIRLSARAHPITILDRAHAPPRRRCCTQVITQLRPPRVDTHVLHR